MKLDAEKLALKRQQLVERTAMALAVSEKEALELLHTGRQQSLRLNPLAGSPVETLASLSHAGWEGQQFAWMSEGYSITAGLAEVRDSDAVRSGSAFIQNAASWLPVLALSPQPGERILDVCAAPGGKTTHIAAAACNQAIVVANDSSKSRLIKLRQICNLLHAEIERFTLYDATNLSRKLPGEQFDKILLDAPCSGEGMLNIASDKDLAMWSVAAIKRLHTTQRKLLWNSWQLLRTGGTLVYSTCTMAPEENEAVIDYALRSLPGAEIVPLSFGLPNTVPTVKNWNNKTYNPAVSGALRLKPSREVEAFFVCVLKKNADKEFSGPFTA